MPRPSSRLDKISDLIRRELSLMIQNEVRDPRVGMVSVTAVRVSRDLAHASVYVTVLGKSDAGEAQESIQALNKASGYLRTLLAKEINLRTTPSLKFFYDESVARGAYLSGLIDRAVESDRQRLQDEPPGSSSDED